MRRAIAATVLLASGLVLAQTEPDPTARREANAFMREGNRLLHAGDFEGALDLYRRAYDRLPSPRVLVNVATALGELGRHVEAADTYERVLAAPPEEIPPEMRRQVRDALAEIDGQVGKIRVTVGTDGAAVTVDGTAAGTAPLGAAVRVEPGHHVVAATIEGGPPAQVSVEVARGETASVSLAPSPPAATEEPDGPATAQPDLRVRPETSHPEAPPPEREEATPIWGKWWLWTGVGVVAAGAVTAIVLASGGGSAEGRAPTELGTVP